MSARAEILCVGSELLAGKVNTHVAHLAPRLRDAGLAVKRTATLADDAGLIRDAVSAALARADVVILSGGLGPTFDDITREGAAAAVGRELVYVPALYRGIRRKYRRFGLKVPPSNKRQAWLIAGARALDNPYGSAPGQHFKTTAPERHLYLLPGPFGELEPMFRKYVLPRLRRRYGGKFQTERRAFRFFGLAEAAVNDRLAPLIARTPDCDFTILATLGRVTLHVAAHRRSAAAARRRLGEVRRYVAAKMGRHFVGVDDETLEVQVGSFLRKKKWTLATAESCTGGLVAQLVTAVPGSSKYFKGAIVAYADSVKRDRLGVKAETLDRCGAVSGETAREMAAGARRALGADCAVALTGIAGPGGGTKAKPVGLVRIAVATPRGTVEKAFHFHGNRRQVRQRAAHAALFMLLRRLAL